MTINKPWPQTWFRLMRSEKNLLLMVLIVACVLLLIGLVATLVAWGYLSNGFKHGKGNQVEVCQNEECVQAAAQMIHSLDPNVQPCDDFYQFACGKYESETVLPEDKVRMSPLLDMDFKLHSRLKLVLESPTTPDEPEHERMTKTLFRSCNDIETLSRLGAEPLKLLMAEFGGWPVVEGAKWESHRYETWEESNAAIAASTGVDSIFGLTIDVDMKDTTRRMLALDEGPLGLGNREYYVSPSYANILEAYQDAMIAIAMQFGATKRNAIREMKDVLKLEVQLANISSKPEDRREHSHMFNPMTLGDVKAHFPGVNFDKWFGYLAGAKWNLTDDEIINVIDVPFFEQLPNVLNQTSMKTLINYEMWLMASSFIPFLEPELRHPLKILQKILTGTTAEPARWEECVSVTISFLGWPLSSLFVRKYFPPAAKYEMESLVHNLRLAMKENLYDVRWMDNTTKQHALSKLKRMRQKIGYPDYINNVTKITQDIKGLGLNDTYFFGNILILTRRRIERELSKLRKRINRNDWNLPPAMVNAFYSPDNNEIMFPAGILQYPVFPLHVPRYVHYGRIGMVIGHEITHGYDDQGRQFDEHGNLVLWWTNVTLTEFSNRAKCFVDQYGDIVEPVTGHKLNGKLTLGENIADNGAIKLAHRAYQLFMSNTSTTDREQFLPGFGNYSMNQLFFIAYATSWCEVIRPEAVNFFMLTDSHSLTRYRVNVPLQNYPEFANAFQCPVGSFMNPKRRCTLW